MSTKKAKANVGPPTRSNTRNVFLLTILAVTGIVAYWSSFSTPFVFDDLLSIQRNAGVQFGDSLWPTIYGTRPILYSTFALNYIVHGQEVWGYHLVNLGLHLLNGMIIFFIARNLLGRLTSNDAQVTLYSFLAAGFFILHPVQTESVTYISSRSETLSTLFFLIAVFMFIRRPIERIGFAFSLLLLIPFAFGILSKETVISLPAVLLLIDLIFFSRGEAKAVLKRWSFYITFVAGAVLSGYYLVTRVLTGTIGPDAPNQLPRYEFILTELRVLVTYIRLVFLPVNLNLDYDFVASRSVYEPAVLISFLLLGSIIAVAWVLRKKEPIIAFAIFWFFITLSPTSSVVPIADTIVEHRLYLPMVGLCLAFPFVVERALGKVRKRTSVTPLSVCIAILCVLLIGTAMRNQVWTDEIRLWTDVVSKSPEKARAYNNLAIAHSKRGEYDKSIAALKGGLEHVHGNIERRAFTEALGNMYLQMGRFEGAVAAFEKTTQVEDKKAAAFAYNNLGVTYLRILQDLEQRRGQMSEGAFQSEREDVLAKSEQALTVSMELDPSFFWPYDSYLSVTFERGKADDLYQRFLTEGSAHQDARTIYGLGKIAMLRNDFATAAEYLKKATILNREEKVPFLHLGFCLQQLHRSDEAIASYVQAIRLDPQFIDARQNLGMVYSQQKQFAKALENFQDVVRMDPNNVPAHLEMAKIFIEKGDRRQAREHLSLVLSVAPQDDLAKQLWQMTGS